METLGFSFVPLAAFWASFTSVIKAAEFVNGIRDSVITGNKNNTILSPPLRKAMYYDWYLSMIATIIACLLFSSVIGWMAWYVSYELGKTAVVWAVVAVAVFPLSAAILFVLCGISDRRAMMLAMSREMVTTSYTHRRSLPTRTNV